MTYKGATDENALTIGPGLQTAYGFLAGFVAIHILILLSFKFRLMKWHGVLFIIVYVAAFATIIALAQNR